MSFSTGIDFAAEYEQPPTPLEAYDFLQRRREIFPFNLKDSHNGLSGSEALATRRADSVQNKAIVRLSRAPTGERWRSRRTVP